VLLASYREWGTDCVARLNGMFAFALADRGRGRVFLARDRAGEKPLFYRLAEGRLSFAPSEGLMADPDAAGSTSRPSTTTSPTATSPASSASSPACASCPRATLPSTTSRPAL
jgi:hypothetical protein